MTAPTQQRQLSVLIVEDKPNAAKALSLVLERDGRVKTVVAPSMTLALAALARGGVDAVLADLGLPDCPAEETVATLRRATNAPILAVTGLGNGIEAKVFVDGADEFLEKGVLNPDRLTQVIHNAHARRESTLRAADVWRGLDSTAEALKVAAELERRLLSCEEKIKEAKK